MKIVYRQIILISFEHSDEQISWNTKQIFNITIKNLFTQIA